MVRDSSRDIHLASGFRIRALPGIAFLALALGCGREPAPPPAGGPPPKPAPVASAPPAGPSAQPASPAVEPKTAAAPGVRLRFLVTGETQGYLTPCGCTDGMLGGLPRRGTLVGRERASSGRAVVLIDNGGLVKDNGRQSEIKIDTLLASYAAMGYAAVVPGGADLSLGRTLAASLANHPTFPLVAANLKAEGIQGFIAPYRVARTSAAGGAEARVGIAGVIDPALAPEYGLGEGVEISDPVEALRRILPALREASDVRVLLAHAPKDRARAWAQEVPGFDVIVTGLRQDDPPETAEAIGEARLFHTGIWGKYIVRIDLDLGTAGRSWGYRRVPMSEEIPSDPEIGQFLVAYQRIIRELGGKGELIGERKPHPRDRFAGSSACTGCHEPSWGVYVKSKHAHAMGTLQDLGVQEDPECLLCHVVGWPYDSGFRSMRETPALAGVGCEECHGPGKKHAEGGGDPKLGRVEESVCRRCHTDIQSPEFTFEKYWAPIRHEE